MSVSGDHFGNEANTCYLAVLAAETPKDMWLLGGVFLEKYYTVLDASPHVERDLDYI